MTTGTNAPPDQAGNPCLRCGMCCEEIFIPLTMAEARRIANRMTAGWEYWLEKYVDGGLEDGDTLFLSKVDGVCVFLEREDNAGPARCAIHDCKPSACRDWAPDPRGRYCQQGQNRRLATVITPLPH